MEVHSCSRVYHIRREHRQPHRVVIAVHFANNLLETRLTLFDENQVVDYTVFDLLQKAARIEFGDQAKLGIPDIEKTQTSFRYYLPVQLEGKPVARIKVHKFHDKRIEDTTISVSINEEVAHYRYMNLFQLLFHVHYGQYEFCL